MLFGVNHFSRLGEPCMNKSPVNTINASTGWRLTHPTVFANFIGIVRIMSLAVLLLIGWLDYITGYEFGFFIFYFIPVAIAAWYCGPKDGICIAIASAVCWYLSDRLTHHPYSKAYFIYWEMFMRLISFLTTSMTLSKIRDLVLKEERMIAELLETRNQLAKYSEGVESGCDGLSLQKVSSETE
jgi:K+-sensing histidine kinase KdpD